MAIFDEWKDKSNQIQREFRQAKAAVEADKMLSVEGKRQKLAALEADRQDKVSTLQTQAQMAFKCKRGGAEKLLEIGAEKALEARIKLFGADGVREMLKYSLESMSGEDIVKAHSEAATPFEKEAIGIYGRAIVVARNGGNPNGAASGLLEQLNQSDIAPAELAQAKEWMSDIDNALKRLPELDVEADNHRIADAVGVDVRYMDQAEA